MIQPTDKLNLLFKGMNTEIGFAHRESPGIGLHVLTIFGSKPSVNFSDLISSSGKVDGVETAILTRPLREMLRNVSHPIEIVVV